MQSPIQFQKQPPMATLLDVYSVTSDNNEVASFGYSNANNVAIRMYDTNTPSLGGIFGYNSNSFYFTKDTGSVNVGINTTSNISSALYITGDAQVLGTLTTSNLVVTGNSAFTNFIATIGTVQSCIIYNPTGIDSTNTPYKNIQTNDSVASNLILMTFTLDAGRYFYNANIPYKSLDPTVTIGTSDSTIGLYSSTVTTFKGINDTPLQKQLINFTSTGEQMSTNVLFYLDISAKTDYIIALVGKGNNIQVGGNGFVCSGGMISIAGLGTDNSYTLRRPLQIAPVRQTFILSAPSSNFAVQTTGLYQITQTSNVEVFRNGIKLVYYSTTSNDYTVSYTNDIANTYFNIKTASFLATQDIVDIKVYPEPIVGSAFQSGYLYQTIGKSEEYYANLNVTPNSNTVLFQYNSNIGIGVTMPIQPLDVRGQCIVSSNVGIGTTLPLNKLHIEGNTYITGGIQYNYEVVTGSGILSSNLPSIINTDGGIYTFTLPTPSNAMVMRKPIYLVNNYGNYTINANNVNKAVITNINLIYADWVINQWQLYRQYNTLTIPIVAPFISYATPSAIVVNTYAGAFNTTYYFTGGCGCPDSSINWSVTPTTWGNISSSTGILPITFPQNTTTSGSFIVYLANTNGLSQKSWTYNVVNIYSFPTITSTSPSAIFALTASGAVSYSYTFTGTAGWPDTALNWSISPTTYGNIASDGSLTITFPQGTNASGSFTVTLSNTNGSTQQVWSYNVVNTYTQQGSKLVGTGYTVAPLQGRSIAISADGNTLAVGGDADNNLSLRTGAVWIFIRSGSTWSQQGSKLVGTGYTGASSQGTSVALSADGNTLAVGGYQDNTNIGAVWIFIRSGSTWSQQGSKLVGSGYVGTSYQGKSISLSADGNTLAIGGYYDNTRLGAVWIFIRSGSTWTQQGTKLTGTSIIGTNIYQGNSVALSSDGNTLAFGGNGDNSSIGAIWIFIRSGSTWSQQGSKLVGSGYIGTPELGYSLSLSSDGNTLAIGGYGDNSYIGATWIFIRSGSTWSQQGSKLIGTGYTGAALQGSASSLSSNGNILVVGGYGDNTNIGATWIFSRSGSTWSQYGTKIIGTGYSGTPIYQGQSLALSTNGTLAVGGYSDNTNIGATWVFT